MNYFVSSFVYLINISMSSNAHHLVVMVSYGTQIETHTGMRIRTFALTIKVNILIVIRSCRQSGTASSLKHLVPGNKKKN
jgi:hypothetical protein